MRLAADLEFFLRVEKWLIECRMIPKILFQKLDPRAQTPRYQTEGASGFDFHSLKEVTLRAGEVSLVPTGLAAEIPEGYEIQVRARSGLSLKAGVFLVNGIGTIDADYRGEIKIILSTLAFEPVVLPAGERIAQGILVKVEKALIEDVKELSPTLRDIGGFGSTGIAAKVPSLRDITN